MGSLRPQHFLFPQLSTADPTDGGRVRVRGIRGGEREVERGTGMNGSPVGRPDTL